MLNKHFDEFFVTRIISFKYEIKFNNSIIDNLAKRYLILLIFFKNKNTVLVKFFILLKIILKAFYCFIFIIKKIIYKA